MTLRGVLDVVLSDPGMARVVSSAGSAEVAVTAPPPVQPLVAAALAARKVRIAEAIVRGGRSHGRNDGRGELAVHQESTTGRL